MKILGLDISTSTGWALFNDAQLSVFGVIQKKQPVTEYPEEYPINFLLVTQEVTKQMLDLVANHKPDLIVIEETNKTGRFGSRHSQKLLEFLHYSFLSQLPTEFLLKVKYVNTSEWRKTLKLSVAESKKKAKPFIKELDQISKQIVTEKDKAKKLQLKTSLQEKKSALKSKCLYGKIDKKSISVGHVNATFNLNLKKTNNDICDAICLVDAYLKGAKTLNNKDIFSQKE